MSPYSSFDDTFISYSDSNSLNTYSGTVRQDSINARRSDGGDGMAARELLKYPETRITLVDIDPGMTELCSADPVIAKVNCGSLSDERLTVINDDAYKFLKESDERFDVIIVDLPDPNNEALNKLYKCELLILALVTICSLTSN